jgi:hypothetical protein
MEVEGMSNNKDNDDVVVLKNLSNFINLSKTYHFEDEDINCIDLSGMENITADQMIIAQKMVARGGNVTAILESNIEYLLILASMATGKPIEFFKRLNAKDTVKVKNRVAGFFFRED